VSVGTIWRFMRPATLPAVVAGVGGGAVAASGGWPESSTALVAAVCSAILLTGASNGINQIADLDTDRVNCPDRPLPAGRLTVSHAWSLVAVLIVLSFAVAALVNLPYLICIMVTLPVTAAYSLPPLRMKRVPLLANAAIATPRGLLMVIAGWAAGGGADRREAWILGALAWVYVFGAATTKDFADVEGDRATGCRTLPLIWGPRAAARFVAPFLVLPFLVYPLAGGLGWLPGGVAPWGALGGLLAAAGLVAATLLLRNPMPPGGGRPHPAWGLMYLQLAGMHIGAAVLFATQ
jgi:4-hydroxybenzoate polyprenyltransferase